MDEFLQPNALYENLLYKYQKHGKLVVAVDFDRTLYDTKNIGATYEMVMQLVRDLYNAGNYIIIWTGNKNVALMKSYLWKCNIPYHSINEDAPFVKIPHIGRKIFANVFIDDRAGLREVYDTLTRLLKTINYEKLD